MCEGGLKKIRPYIRTSSCSDSLRCREGLPPYLQSLNKAESETKKSAAAHIICSVFIKYIVTNNQIQYVPVCFKLLCF